MQQNHTWALRCLLLLSLGASIAPLSAQEDPEVARARAEVRRQYEANKLIEQQKAETARLAAKQKAIALTRQGAVTLFNTSNTGINYSIRWLQWDGTYTNWIKQRVEARNSMFYGMAGGIKLQVQFSSNGGGTKNYALESATVPSEIRASATDGRPYYFNWRTSNHLDLAPGKPPK
jgi:hypothetical protein